MVGAEVVMAAEQARGDGFGGVLVVFWAGLAAIAVIFGVGAWLESDSTTSEVCADAAQVRVADTDCTTHRPGDGWVYYRTGVAIPAVDGSTAAGSHSAPDGAAEPGVPDDGAAP